MNRVLCRSSVLRKVIDSRCLVRDMASMPKEVVIKKYPFLPINSDASEKDGKKKLQGIVFDMDGTLCEPQNYMFGEMRRALGISKSVDIIDHINELPKEEQPTAWKKIETIEREAMVKQVAQPGLQRLLDYLDSKGMRRAILTRNFNTPVTHFLDNHVSSSKSFSPILTREFKPPKPSPAGMLHIAEKWNVEGGKVGDQADAGVGKLPLMMVGDSVDDIIAGYDAGAITVLLASAGKEELLDDTRTHIVIHQLDQLIDVLEHADAS